MRFQILNALGPVRSDTRSPGLILKNLENIDTAGNRAAPCTGMVSRFNYSFPCNFYIRKYCGTINIPLDQENCGACSLL